MYIIGKTSKQKRWNTPTFVSQALLLLQSFYVLLCLSLQTTYKLYFRSESLNILVTIQKAPLGGHIHALLDMTLVFFWTCHITNKFWIIYSAAWKKTVQGNKCKASSEHAELVTCTSRLWWYIKKASINVLWTQQQTHFVSPGPARQKGNNCIR